MTNPTKQWKNEETSSTKVVTKYDVSVSFQDEFTTSKSMTEEQIFKDFSETTHHETSSETFFPNVENAEGLFVTFVFSSLLFSNMFAFQKPLTFARFKKDTVSMFWRQM
jgi:hypothetical protein